MLNSFDTNFLSRHAAHWKVLFISLKNFYPQICLKQINLFLKIYFCFMLKMIGNIIIENRSYRKSLQNLVWISESNVLIRFINFGPHFLQQNYPKLIIYRLAIQRLLAFCINRYKVINNNLLRLTCKIYYQFVDSVSIFYHRLDIFFPENL